jgi:hypothetical protein
MKRHRFHAICPYFAMFPETFVQKNLVYSKPGDVVFDPFSGRGTTVFQSLLSNRKGIAIDINPIAVCVSRGKAAAPVEALANARLKELQEKYIAPENFPEKDSEFFKYCYHPNTLQQIMYLRSALDWRKNNIDCFLAALVLGRLHGESQRSLNYLSNQMPRTISTKPVYSVNWWKKHGFMPPVRDAFELLKREIAFRYASPPPPIKGLVKEGDARKSGQLLHYYKGKVKLVVTSPPYLDTTDFAEDQWLRNWFLGGEARVVSKGKSDHRHVNRQKYWDFIGETFKGMSPLLAPTSTIAIRIGGKTVSFEEAEFELKSRLRSNTERKVKLISQHQTDIIGGQLQSFRPNAEGTKREFDFVFRIH